MPLRKVLLVGNHKTYSLAETCTKFVGFCLAGILVNIGICCNDALSIVRKAPFAQIDAEATARRRRGVATAVEDTAPLA